MFERIISSDEKGFTLIEVLISISIFSILTIGMLQFFNQAMDFSNKNEDKTLGIYVARNMISYMEQQSFSSIDKFYVKESGSTSIQSSACNNDKLTSDEMVLNQTEKITINGVETSRCALNFSPKINNRQFSVTVEVKKHTDKNLQSSLIPMTVNVSWDQSNTQLEGYIANENSR
ncbi:prepilin-type N-terminal cleavage/methylation domain-containing protein [Metabacillus sp. KIGAM252]|uniref:Prepilin-type N-terminal cleavage/methylation domain-containing protein n=1 Tax=Metabacillus flavus TaxID=2823519 RepID=A0ABS5LGL9_9BACI|nr:prepilin-type N-terminal cleavage/methylation domain-containing protein [Metabacillus flavus]MBS2969895.1 prepilin-type N-terminal cleavage/methylation domain-containing protein [Metabacillus flavus]